MVRSLAASGSPDTLWYPTSLGKMLEVNANATATVNWVGNTTETLNYVIDFSKGITKEMYHSFNPTLLLALESNTAAPASGYSISV